MDARPRNPQTLIDLVGWSIDKYANVRYPPTSTPVIPCFSPTWKPILFCAVPRFTSGWFESGEGSFNGRPYNHRLPQLRLEKAIEGGMTNIDFSYTLPITLLYKCKSLFYVDFNRYTYFGKSKFKNIIKIWLLFIYYFEIQIYKNCGEL